VLLGVETTPPPPPRSAKVRRPPARVWPNDAALSPGMLVDGSWYPTPKRTAGPAVGPSGNGGTRSVCGVVASATLRRDNNLMPSISPTTAARATARWRCRARRAPRARSRRGATRDRAHRALGAAARRSRRGAELHGRRAPGCRRRPAPSSPPDWRATLRARRGRRAPRAVRSRTRGRVARRRWRRTTRRSSARRRA
jgi:hypothetical protein